LLVTLYIKIPTTPNKLKVTTAVIGSRINRPTDKTNNRKISAAVVIPVPNTPKIMIETPYVTEKLVACEEFSLILRSDRDRSLDTRDEERVAAFLPKKNSVFLDITTVARVRKTNKPATERARIAD
jgi:hypothetical protein